MTGPRTSSAGEPADRLRLLFIARSFPPTVGGMATFAYHLSESLRQQADVTMLVNRYDKIGLPVFFPYALARAIYLTRGNRIQAVHLGDALLAPLGLALKKVTGLPVTSSVCGLDITYPNRLHQRVVPPALARLDMTMPISQATAVETRAHAGEETPAVVIPLGVASPSKPNAAAIRDFRQLAGTGPGERMVLSVNRLVKRKGVAWFTSSVLRRLPDNTTYVVIGEGPQASAIRSAATSAGVANRLRLLGRVSDELLAAAYHAADVFVMPNIPVTGDMEGFGLVALEASASGLPVVAARLEGITEAVQHDRNGLLVTARSADDYVSTITSLLTLPPEDLRALGASYADFTLRTFGWDKTARRYLDVIGEIAAAKASAATSDD